MEHAELFLGALDRKAKPLAAGARATFEANKELCSWLLNPLARWAQAAYGDKVFDDAACGYARYCFGVAQAQKVYERAGRYTPEGMPEIMSGVYEDEGYAVPYMWAAILIYALWPSMIEHIAMLRDEFFRRLPRNASVLELASGCRLRTRRSRQLRGQRCTENRQPGHQRKIPRDHIRNAGRALD